MLLYFRLSENSISGVQGGRRGRDGGDAVPLNDDDCGKWWFRGAVLNSAASADSKLAIRDSRFQAARQ